MTTATTSSAKPAPAGTDKALAAKWGKTLLSGGFTALPDVIFRKSKALGLNQLDVLVLLHLASYWWKPGEHPRPSKARVAAALDCDPRTVQRSIQKMEKLGYVRRISRKAAVGDNLPNAYDLRGLIKPAEKLGPRGARYPRASRLRGQGTHLKPESLRTY